VSQLVDLEAPRRQKSDQHSAPVHIPDQRSDKDPEVQRLLMEKIFPDQARVPTVEECVGAIP
jgi:hypothetical protein